MIYNFVDLIPTLVNYILHSIDTKCSLKKKNQEDIVLFLRQICFFCFFYLGLFRIPISLNHFLTLANLHWILRILISKWEDSFLILSQEIFQSALFWLHALLKGSMHVACAHCFDIWFQCISDATRMTQREKFLLTTKLWHRTKRKLSEHEVIIRADILSTFYVLLQFNYIGKVKSKELWRTSS